MAALSLLAFQVCSVALAIQCGGPSAITHEATDRVAARPAVAAVQASSGPSLINVAGRFGGRPTASPSLLLVADPPAAANSAANGAAKPIRTLDSGRGESQIVPANQEMVTLEQSKGTLIRLRQPASAVFVADPEIADVQVKSPGIIYVFARRPGDTVLYAVAESDKVLAAVTLRVTHDLTSLREAIRAIASDAPVEVRTSGEALVISGTVYSALQAEEIRRIATRFTRSFDREKRDPEAIINQLQIVAPNQVNLRVRVAEIQRETLKNLGFNWDAVARFGSFALGFATFNPVKSLDTGNLFVRNNETSSIIGGVRTTQLDINGVIDALDRERMVTLLAEPNLTAMSGETASFLAGGEFPIPISVENDRIGIEFKSFGVSLAFTPTILSEQRISLRVRPEVSQLSDNGSIKLGNLVIPALATRRAETTVELGSGQSFAIAGLLQNNTEQVAQSVPGLSQIPILGPLFRSDKYLRNESELVIIVTPYLVRPAGSPTRLALPTDGLVRPNDFERILAGNTYRPQIAGRRGGPRSAAGGALIGPAGFILE